MLTLDASEPLARAITDETPLHWAASSDDVGVVDAPLEAGADLEADASVVDGGTPLADAVVFGRWNAAGRLLERGATPNLWQAADINRIGHDNLTPIEAAARGHAQHLVGWLQARSARCAAEPR